MMAEVEVALCYNGFQGWFDGIDKGLKTGVYDDTFLDIIENDIIAKTKAFERWLENIKGETRKRSDDLLRHIDEELKAEKALRAKPKDQSAVGGSDRQY